MIDHCSHLLRTRFSQFFAYNLWIKRFPNTLPIGENLGCVAVACMVFNPQGPPCASESLSLPRARLSGGEGSDCSLVGVTQGEHHQSRIPVKYIMPVTQINCKAAIQSQNCVRSIVKWKKYFYSMLFLIYIYIYMHRWVPN